MIVFELGHICFRNKIQQQAEEAEMEKFLSEKKLKGRGSEFLG